MRWLEQLGSMRRTLALLALVAGICIVGTICPCADVFHAWWFFLLVAALAVSLLACAARQARALRGLRGAAAGRVIASLSLHGSLLAILAGAVVRGACSERGDLRMHVGETAEVFQTAKGPRQLPFAVTLRRFVVETHAPSAADRGRIVLHWPGNEMPVSVPADLGVAQIVRPAGATAADDRACTVRVLRIVPDFQFNRETRAVVSQSDEPRNPAVQVEIRSSSFAATNWLFARFPGFRMPMLAADPVPFQLVYEFPAAAGGGRAPIRNFRSTVAITQDGRTVYEGDVAVNAPLSWRGYALYQAGYNPDDPDWTSLQVVRDPSVPVVYAGFALLLAGLFFVLFVWPQETFA